MPKPCSLDLRMRVLREVEAGASRREAAECVEVSASSAIKWMQRLDETGSIAAKPSGGSISPLEAHAAVLLGLIAEQPDLTLDEIVVAMRKRRIAGSRSAVWRFFGGTISASKKTLRAAEQKRADVARARRRWMREQGMFDPARLVFIDESVLQSTEGVQHELKPFVKLRERWGRAPRDRLSGAGLKPVRAAAVKSRGGERRIKSSDQTEQVSVRKTNESEPSEDASL